MAVESRPDENVIEGKALMGELFLEPEKAETTVTTVENGMVSLKVTSINSQTLHLRVLMEQEDAQSLLDELEQVV